MPEACSTWFLPRIVGVSQALEWFYSGRVFSAQDALAGKLISKIVAPDQLIPTARAMAREIIDNTAPVSIALIRQMTWRMLGADHPMEAHRLDSRGMYARGLSEDMARRRSGILAEARREIHRQGVDGDAVVLSVVESAEIRLIALCVVCRECDQNSSQSMFGYGIRICANGFS